MNVTDQWMLERMQQMAANMAASLPQVGQSTDTSKPEKGDSFKDLMDKAKDTKVEDSQKDSTVKKNDAAQKKEPTQKSESKVVTNMNDPRIKAMDPATQAQIAAGFITPGEPRASDRRPAHRNHYAPSAQWYAGPQPARHADQQRR